MKNLPISFPPPPPPSTVWSEFEPGEAEHIIFSSFGNDSVALIQWAHEKDLSNVVVVHSDTGWASEQWSNRVQKAKAWCLSLGFKFITLGSKGMVRLAKERKGWPRNGMQFCTSELKIAPARAWMEIADPDKDAICMVGVRRAESRARRKWPEWVEESDNHGGRSLWSPICSYTDEERNELLRRAGWEPLPHSSMECFPCVNANRNDIRLLTDDRVNLIEELEKEMGFTSKGKPRTFFRPYRHMGAVGIREVVKWARSDRGEYRPPVDLGEGQGCDSGMCDL